MPTIEEIHESLVNGQRRQMVEIIDEYGLYDFFNHYSEWLEEHFYCDDLSYKLHFSDCVVSYFRIKNR